VDRRGYAKSAVLRAPAARLTVPPRGRAGTARRDSSGDGVVPRAPFQRRGSGPGAPRRKHRSATMNVVKRQIRRAAAGNAVREASVENQRANSAAENRGPPVVSVRVPELQFQNLDS